MIKKHFNKIFIVFATCFMLVAGIFISIDRIKTVNAEVDITPYNIVYLNNWTSHEQNGIYLGYSNRMWTDGTNIYYSNSGYNYVLDISTSTWSTKTWTGLTSFDGRYIWSDGTNIYYSYNGSNYVLDISTSTWTTKTWTGLTSFLGSLVWTDGTNIYYSYNGYNYVLDISTSTWTTKTWNGLTTFDGNYIWTDGTNIYYSNNGSYVLDILTSTWSRKTFTGYSALDGRYIWTDGVNIYSSYSSDQYVLDISTSSWSVKTWTGLTNFSGLSVFDKLPSFIICYAGNSSVSGLWYSLDSQQVGGGGNETNTSYSFDGSSYINYRQVDENYLYVANSHFFIEDIVSSVPNGTDYVEIRLYDDYLYATSLIVTNNNVDSSILSYLDTNTRVETVLSITRNTSYTNYSFPIGYNSPNGFVSLGSTLFLSTNGWSNSDIIGCTLSSSLVQYSTTTNLLTYTFNYFNSSNENLQLDIKSEISNIIPNSQVVWSTRTIYFTQNTSETGTYQDGYNTGYSDGQSIGFANGEDVGYSNGYSVGYTAGLTAGDSAGYSRGYSSGYTAGVASVNNYSFFGLISAVVDVPFTYFSSILNFDLLGFNILNFMTALLTLALVVVVVKKLMGR